MPFFCMPVLFKEISDGLGLNLFQVGMIWGIAGLPGLFLAFIAGMVGDRFGTRKTLFLACLFNGVTGALRGIAFGYNSLLVFSFLFGIAMVPFSFAVHKSAGEWFTGRQLGMANGVLAMGMGVGNALGSLFSANIFSPALGGWRNVMFFYGAIAVLISFFWLRTRQPVVLHPRAANTSNGEAFLRSLKETVRVKSVWILAVAFMFYSGCYSGVIGYLPLYLRSSGWSPAAADGALGVLTGASVVGVVPLSFLSDRIGSRKIVVYIAITVYLICVGLLSVSSSNLVWILAIFAGLMQEGLWALLITMVMETEGIGSKNSGTALGLVMTFSSLGSFFAPPLGNRIAGISPGYAFLFWSAMVITALILIYFVKETGWKKRKQLSEVEAAGV